MAGVATMTRRDSRTDSPDEDPAALFARLAQVEAELKGIDELIAAADKERIAAETEMRELRGSGGSAVRFWQAEEARDQAAATIRALLVQRRPLNEEFGRLATYAEPLRKRDIELAQLRAALEGWRRLEPVLQLLDDLAELVDACKPYVTQSGGSFSVDSELLRTVRMLGPNATGLPRPRLEHAIRASIESCESGIQRLEAGLL